MNVSKRAKKKVNSVHGSKKAKPKIVIKISNPQIEKMELRQIPLPLPPLRLLAAL
jgi:hypothetical protein